MLKEMNPPHQKKNTCFYLRCVLPWFILAKDSIMTSPQREILLNTITIKRGKYGGRGIENTLYLNHNAAP